MRQEKGKQNANLGQIKADLTILYFLNDAALSNFAAALSAFNFSGLVSTAQLKVAGCNYIDQSRNQLLGILNNNAGRMYD